VSDKTRGKIKSYCNDVSANARLPYEKQNSCSLKEEENCFPNDNQIETNGVEQMLS
jgi:hypothetical protein